MIDISTQYYMNDLILNLYNGGYLYYVYNTNSSFDNDLGITTIDSITLYASKQPIEYDSNSFKFSDGYIRYDITISNDYTNNLDVFKQSHISGGTDYLILLENENEFYSSNADNYLGNNQLSLIEYNSNNSIAYNVDKNEYYLLPIIVSMIFMWLFFSSWFARVRGSKQ